MSEVGKLSASLTLEGAAEFQRQMQAVGAQLKEGGNQGRSFGQLGAQAFKTAAGATVGLTSAAGAYLAVLTKTGVAYNSLQQNSRAALSVLLGGTEQANAQMDKLDAFARNSPFSKTVFIDAQQQLLGFGVEAKKVIPYMDALQNAVAATGGSNAQLDGLVQIMAKIQSSSKITAVDLMQFGNRGVDAAALIGSQMGKTAQEIREQITDGALGAEEALDALAAGMQSKFGGTTELVKEQWTGAVDRVRAANRDIGAIIAEPFVSKNGGGMAVTWGNQVADVLRAIEGQAKPVMEILTARGGGMFAGITEGLDSAQASIERFNPAKIETALDAMANHAPAIGVLSGVLLSLGSSVGPLGAVFGALNLTINPVVAAFVGLAAASPEVRAGLAEVAEAGAPLLGVIGELAQILSGALTTAMPVVADGLGLIASVAGPLVDIVAQIPAPVLLGVAAFLALHKATGPLAGGITAVAESLMRFGQYAQVQASLGGTTTGMGALSRASMVARSSVEQLGGALKTAFLANPVGIALTVVAGAVALWAAENAKAQQKVQEHQGRVAELKGTLDATSGALTDASKSMIGQVAATDEMASALQRTGVTGSAFVTALTEGGAAAKQFESDVMQSAQATAEFEKYSESWGRTAEKLGVPLDTLVRSSLGFTDAQAEVDAALRKTGGSFTGLERELDNTTRGMQKHMSGQHEVISTYEAQRNAIEEAQREQQRLQQATREAAAAMTDAARSNQAFNDALSVANDATQDAETRLRALKQALDEISGGTKTARQAQTDLAETALNLRDALAATGPEGEKLWKSFVDGAGAIETSTREGIAFERMLDSTNDKMLQAMQAASDEAMAHNDREGAVRNAIAAGKEHVETLQEELRLAGMGEEAIAALTAEYLEVPELVATTMQLEGVTEVGQQILEILGELALVEEGKTITIANEGGEETAQILRDLGYEVESTDDYKTITITSEGADTVTEQLDQIAGLQVPEKIFKVDAETADALAKFDGVETVKINDKWSYVYGNNTDAVKKIETVKNDNPKAKVVEIKAEDSGFWGAWGRIAGAAMSKIVGIGGGSGKFAGGIVESNNFAQGGFGGEQVRHRAAGGYSSGIYNGVMGGLWHMGVDGVPTNFAEKELGVPWEVYISGREGDRQANVGYALEALRRLGSPSIPIAALAGTPQVRHRAAGGITGAQVVPSQVSAGQSDNWGSSGPLVGNVYLGGGVTNDDFVELERRIDFWKRGGAPNV